MADSVQETPKDTKRYDCSRKFDIHVPNVVVCKFCCSTGNLACRKRQNKEAQRRLREKRLRQLQAAEAESDRARAEASQLEEQVVLLEQQLQQTKQLVAHLQQLLSDSQKLVLMNHIHWQNAEHQLRFGNQAIHL